MNIDDALEYIESHLETMTESADFIVAISVLLGAYHTLEGGFIDSCIENSVILNECKKVKQELKESLTRELKVERALHECVKELEHALAEAEGVS